MNFLENILEIFGITDIGKECLFKGIMLGDSALYLENVCGISHYTEEEILVRLRRGGIVVRGNDLFVKKYCAGDLAICGKIKSVERV